MGDAGSLFLGAWFGQAALDVSRGEPGQGGAWLAALALLPLLADVFLTLGWRTLRGRPLLMAHRDHAYQRLIDLSGWSHSRVAMVYAGLTAACLAVAWGVQAVAPGAGPFAAFWIAAFMMAVLWWRVPRRPEKVS